MMSHAVILPDLAMAKNNRALLGEIRDAAKLQNELGQEEEAR